MRQSRPSSSKRELLRRDPPIALGRITSAAGLVVLLLGVPLILTDMDLAPPVVRLIKEVAHPGAWSHVLQGPLSEETVVKIVALVAWAAWLWLLLCVFLEVVASIRGVPTTRLPGSRHAQSLAALLVGACLALLPAPRTATHLRIHAIAPASAQVQPVALNRVALLSDGFSGWPSDGVAGQVIALEPNGSRPSAPSVVDTAGVDAATSGSRTYVVKPGDTLWSIAEDELGSPLRWREIAALNLGRPQSDGRQLTDAHWIFPGWVLLLPGDAPSPQQLVAPTATSSSFSAPEPEEAPQSVRLPSLVEDLPSASRTTNGSLASPSMKAPAGHHDHLPIAPIGFGVLGASVIALLERMRRAQQRHRSRGLRITLPEGELADLEQGLRLGADLEAVEWIDLGQRLLAASMRARTVGYDGRVWLPRIVGVRLKSDVVEFLLDFSSMDGAMKRSAGEPAPPPPPFEDGPEGSSWLLPRDPDLLERMRSDPEVRGMDTPVPGLVTLGRDEQGLILLDLERVGSLSIAGSASEALAQAMAIEIACSRWSDQVDIIIVGMPPDMERLERVFHATNIASVVQRVDRRVRERRRLLEIVRSATNYATRWVEGGDAWDLCVVVCMNSAVDAEPEALEELVELAGEGIVGLSVVFCSAEPHESRTRITADGGPLSLEHLARDLHSVPESTVWPQSIPPGFAAGVTSLVNLGSRLDAVAPADSPYGETTLETDLDVVSPSSSASSSGSPRARQQLSTRRKEVQSGEIEVKVLGPIEVVGADRPFTRAWALELVVYLAFHRSGASTDSWSTALWPDRLMAPASLHSTASAARRSLGVSQSGDDHLPRSHGRLSLGPGVTTDWDRFIGLSHEEAPEAWKDAIGLIRGRPFDGLRSTDWALLEGITAMIESEVVDLASRCAEWFLARRDSSGAEWVARQALRVSPYDERMYRVLMRAADVAGNPQGIESVMSELSRLVAEDVEPFDAVHPETLELYRTLSRRSFSSRG